MRRKVDSNGTAFLGQFHLPFVEEVGQDEGGADMETQPYDSSQESDPLDGSGEVIVAWLLAEAQFFGA